MGLQDREWFKNPGKKAATAENTEVPASPDLLTAHPKGEGKRLNRKPLLIGGAALGVVALVMVYTMNERASKDAAPNAAAEAQGKGRGGGSAAAKPPEFLAEAQAGSNASPQGPTAPTPLLYEGQEAQMVQTGGAHPQLVQQAPVGHSAQSPYASQWEAYNEHRAKVAQDRFTRASSALGAESGVEIGRRDGASAGRGAPTGAGMTNPGAGMQMAGGPPMPAALGGGRGGGSPDLNRQEDKRAFLETSGGRNPYAAGRVEAAMSANEVKAGTVIPAVLTGGVNSDLPGQVTARVTRNVFDTATGRRLLIPQGATLVGVYDSSITAGQSRVLVAWNRLIYPDGSSIDLGSMPGADRAGYGGLSDQVNNHHARTFGSAIFLSLFSAGAQLSQPQATNGENQSSGQTVAAAMGQQLGQLGMETARRNMQIQPTLMLRPGLNMNVQVTQDLILREWRAR